MLGGHYSCSKPSCGRKASNLCNKSGTSLVAIHYVIPVYQVIAHPSHRRPWYPWVLPAQLKGQSLDSFTDHNQLIEHGRLGLEIFEKILFAQTLYECQNSACGPGNIQ